MRAPRSSELSCANWQIEAAYRMQQSNLDPEVTENPDELVVYGGIGKAARQRPPSGWAACCGTVPPPVSCARQCC